MNGSIKLESPSEVRVTLKVTMTIGEWKKIEDALALDIHAPHWPVGNFIALLRRLILTAEREFADSEGVE